MQKKPTQPGRPQDILLPSAFPHYSYTPFGYLDNPAHSGILNRSGIIRSAPPLGFGFWCRRMPWSYGEGVSRRVNYLSFLDLALQVNDVCLQTPADFEQRQINLHSKYHTKHMMSYDFSVEGLTFSARYFLASENALVCILDIDNPSAAASRDAQVSVHATNIYGFVETSWWGSDGIATHYQPDANAMVSTIYAYGDVFILGGDNPSRSHKASNSRKAWTDWIRSNDASSMERTSFEFPGAMFAMLDYDLRIPAGGSQRLTLVLARGVNQKETLETYHRTQSQAVQILNRQLADDADFYAGAPQLTGSFPMAWKEGWIYDLETIRMTIRPPLGIYKHHWDGMQIFTPRAVLGETMLDALCLSYSDMALAKEVIYGVFADAPMENVPCSREDGSMNMIGASGNECGTAPIWGMPFVVIQSVYERCQDKDWLANLYPYLKKYLEWWAKNRTDEAGWYHCDNSWESGQDGSKRFTFEGGNEADVASFVRTVDVEAVMAHAMLSMTSIAKIIGKEEDIERWQALAQKPLEHTRSMFVDGWFRDFDGRTGQPIILPDYYDVMMLMPLAVDVATPEQTQALKDMFGYFQEHSMYWLEWPSFMFPFTEAAWTAGMTGLAAEALADIGHLIYGRTTGRTLKPVGARNVGLPPEYNYRIPGVATEYWPKQLHEKWQNGAENYGWGATFPSLVIRNLFGFHETGDGFTLAPTIPSNLIPGGTIDSRTFGITNLRYRDLRLDIAVDVQPDGTLKTRVSCMGDGRLQATGGEEGTVHPLGNTQFDLVGPQGARYQFTVV